MKYKFRAWDKTTNQMRGCYGFNDMEREVYVCSVADDEFNGQLKTVHALKRSFDEVVVMQSTGLKDKNDVEIYQGDVLEVEKNEDGTYKGTINGKTFFDRFQGYSSKIEIEGIHNINNLRYWNNRVRVIGNIYENPELLEMME